LNSPWIIEPVPKSHLRDIRLKMIFDYHKWDSQYEDVSTLAGFGLVLDEQCWSQLREQSEKLWKEAIAAEKELLEQSDLYKHLGLTWRLHNTLARIATRGASEQMARVIRFDFHLTADGWCISEANTDVPGGFIESCAFSELLSQCCSGVTSAPDVAAVYAENILSRLGPAAKVGLVHATAYTDDRQVMMFLADRFSSAGLIPELVSPADLYWKDGYAYLTATNEKMEGLVRFFPGEWLPNLPRKNKWEMFFYGSRTPLSNPAYSLITQSKRFPLIWNRLKTDLTAWRQLLPETRDTRDVDWKNNDEWVLKPALGRVGEGIGIHGVTLEKEWRQITKNVLRHPGHWIAQKRFTTVPAIINSEKFYLCIGVFVIDGTTCGLYGRASKVALIDGRAQDIPVVIRKTPAIQNINANTSNANVTLRELRI
jgi:glutathionylspermidine synthase